MRTSDCTLKLAKSCLIKGLDSSSRLHEFQACIITRKLAHGGGKVIRPTHRPSRPLSLLLESDTTAGSECGGRDEVNEEAL